jgi:Immunity protein 26
VVANPPTNFQQLVSSRARPEPGDVFTTQIPDGRYLFGRVIRTDARCFGPGCILVYVFRYLSDEPVAPARLLLSDLLIPPAMVNRLGWSRGYFMTIERRPFLEGERFPTHYFEDGRRGRFGKRLYVNEDNEPVDPPPRGYPVRMMGLGNYRTVDDEVSDALGIPVAPSNR